MEFELPGDLTALSNEALTDLHAQGLQAFNDVLGTDRTAANVATLRDLKDALATIRTEIDARAASEAELEAEAAALAAEVNTEAAADDEGEALEPEDAAEDEDDDAEVAEDKEPVAASAGRKISLPEIAKKQKADPIVHTPEVLKANKVTMIAAADTPGFAAGQEIDWDEVAEAFNRRASSFPKGAGGSAMSAQFAQIRTEWPEELTADGRGNDMEVMDRAADEAKLPGGSLVAAGGWCAPSETLYDFCELESRDGLFSLPSINVKRAGINHTLGPDFRAIFDGSGFCFTEADDIRGAYSQTATEPDPDNPGNPTGTPPVPAGTRPASNTEKPCYDVPCPPFVEDRLDVCGVCVTSGILQDRAYPELTRRVVRGAVTAHIHRMDMKILAEVRNGSTATTMPANPGGATAPLLSAIELQVEEYRYRNRLSRSRSLEAVFPFWVRGAIRADLSRRQGLNLMDVTNAQIGSWFSMRGINPQFVVNWQDDWSNLDNNNGRDFGGVTPQTSWPTMVSFLLYTAGTWVVGRKDLIELTAVYDSTQFRNNNFTALFTEEAYLVAQRCHDSRLINVPICTDGATHGGILLECNGSVTP